MHLKDTSDRNLMGGDVERGPQEYIPFAAINGLH